MNHEAARRQSEAQLRAMGVRVNPHLPTIEDPSELSPRSASAVAGRAFVLNYVIGIGHGQAGSAMLALIEKHGIAEHLSPEERALLGQSHYSEYEAASAQWLAEAVQACAWALGLTELRPLEHCDDNLASRFMGSSVPTLERIASSTLQPFDQLYAQADLHYRLHWAMVQSRLDCNPLPQKEVFVQLRRRTLDWIIGVPYEWDDIPTDT